MDPRYRRRMALTCTKLLSYFCVISWCLDGFICSFLPYDFVKHGQSDVETVVFTSANRETESFGQLYLSGSFIEVYCQLRYRANDTNESRSDLVKRFGEHGMRPWITFTNMTRNASFEFSDLVTDGSETYWKRNISKVEITEEQFTVESSGAWQYLVGLGNGLNLFESSGSLVIKELEPLLCFDFGDEVSAPIAASSPTSVIIRNAACSPGVSAIVPLLDVNETPYSGCFLGVTYSYFSPSSVRWYNLLHMSAGSPDVYSVCKLPTFAECSKLSILDIGIVKNQMVLITSHGIVVSHNFTEALEKGLNQKLKFYNVSKIHPLLDQEMESGILKGDQVRFHYTPHCHSIFISNHKEELCFVYNSQEPSANGSILLCSSSPFTVWSDHTPNSTADQHHNVLGIGHDIQRDREALLVKDTLEGDTLVEIFNTTTQEICSPPFHIDPSDDVKEIYFHPYTSVLFAYGSQVWKSLDGGNSFHQVTALHPSDPVTSFSTDFYGETYSFTTTRGSVYIGKTGVHRVRAIKTSTTSWLNYTIKSLVVEYDRSVIAIDVQVSDGKLHLRHNVFPITADINIPDVLDSSLMVRFLTETKVEFLPRCPRRSPSDNCSNLFSSSHVGQVIHSKYGGSAAVVRLKRNTYPNSAGNGFEGSVIAEVITAFREVQDELTDYPLGVTWRDYNATLTLISDGNAAQWRNEDVGRTIIFPSGLSFLVLELVNTVSVLATAHVAWANSKEDTFQGTFSGWSMYDFGSSSTGNSSWWMTEDECRSVLISNEYTHARFFHLDPKDNLSLTASVVSKAFPSGKRFVTPVPKLLIGNSRLFMVESRYEFSHLNNSLHLYIRQRPFATGSSSLTVFLEGSSLLCRRSSFTIAIHSGCPPTKKLRFLYPLSVSDDVFLDADAIDTRGVIRNMNLPYNYRPPSARGVGIPMTSNVYNADPARSQYRNTYAITRRTYRYKQCLGKSQRSDCGCTRASRLSSLVKHSDCIDRTYRLLFSEILTPRFLVLREGHAAESLASPYYLEELNNRHDFHIMSPSNITLSIADVSMPIMNQGQNSSIEFTGSGLYHFRVFAVQENYTFCNLSDEFIVYVDETPLPYPAKDIVRACTAMGFFVMLYVLYLWNFHGKHKIIMNELEEKRK